MCPVGRHQLLLQDGSEFYTLSEDFSKKFEKEFAKVKYDDGGHGVSDDV